MLSAHVGSQRRRLEQSGSSRPQNVLRLCEAAESSGARSSRLSMLSTRKVIVKESTHHSAQRSMQLGRPVTTSVTKGVGQRHSAALVSIESVLTASTARCSHCWVEHSVCLEQRSCSNEATCIVTAMKAACCSRSPGQLHGRHAITARLRTTNAMTEPLTRHLPTYGTRERSELSSSATVVGARKLSLLRLLKLGSLLPAVKLAIRSLTSPDFFGSRSSLDGLLRRPTTGLPCMLSAARGVLDTVGTRSSMATLPVPAREATDAEKNLWRAFL